MEELAPRQHSSHGRGAALRPKPSWGEPLYQQQLSAADPCTPSGPRATTSLVQIVAPAHCGSGGGPRACGGNLRSAAALSVTCSLQVVYVSDFFKERNSALKDRKEEDSHTTLHETPPAGNHYRNTQQP